MLPSRATTGKLRDRYYGDMIPIHSSLSCCVESGLIRARRVMLKTLNLLDGTAGIGIVSQVLPKAAEGDYVSIENREPIWLATID